MLTFDQVTKQFTETSFGVKDVTFEVTPGEFIFVTGPSGSGKTTLMRLMTKEYTPTTGDIIFEDVNVSKLQNSQVHKLRRKIGVVFQDYRLLHDLNVWENIALPLSIIGKKQHEIEERVTDLLKLVELPDKAPLFPRQLSGGEAQRISIARALATGPSIIFADEPTGNLDSKSALKIARLLHKINELGTTIIFATHDSIVLSELGGLRTLLLENGVLVEDTGIRKDAEDQKKSNEDEKEDENENEVTTEEQKKPIKKKSLGFFSKLLGRKKTATVEEPDDSQDSEDSSKPEEPVELEKSAKQEKTKGNNKQDKSKNDTKKKAKD